MEENVHPNRTTILQQAYATEHDLMTRKRIHDEYTVPPINYEEWVLERHEWHGNEWVLDVGCGPGNYFENVRHRIPEGRYYAADYSAGMVKKAAEHPNLGNIHLLINDVQALPFPDNTFDVALANHMLFHVMQVEQAIRELHRVLKPAGVLLAATNSHFSMPEFNTLSRRALTLLGFPPREDHNEFSDFFEGFSLENGTMKLARRFRAVVRYDIPGTFVFKEVDPVVDYINSTRVVKEPTLPESVTWDEFMIVMTQQVQRLIKHFGELTVNKLSGVLIATDKGGFSSPYFTLLDNA
jgi:SAM-dependent methyltransferase